MSTAVSVIKADIGQYFRVSEKAVDIRRQGFFGNAMLPYSELEYGGIVKKLEDLEGRFQERKK